MPRIRVVLEDDQGNPLGDSAVHVYTVQQPCDTINQIEQVVEEFRIETLPQIEHCLLSQAQQRFAEQGEKAGPGS